MSTIESDMPFGFTDDTYLLSNIDKNSRSKVEQKSSIKV
jgi:hypothetical protein